MPSEESYGSQGVESSVDGPGSVNGAETSSYRRLRVVIIGAGVSGILMAYKVRKYLKAHVDIQILDKSPELGGTWYENRYPGCACDVPSHCYQYSFAPNPQWSKFYASSQEIKAYLTGVAQYFNLERYIRYNSKVTGARWSEEHGTWTVDVDSKTKPYVAEILVNAGGILNDLQIPNITGLDTFAGPVLHTADWDSSVDLEGKRVGVIGSGASAIQLLPQIQPKSSKINIFIRTPSWISPPVALPDADRPDYTYTEREKQAFRSNGETYLNDRKRLESQFNEMFMAFTKGSSQQQDLRATLETWMEARISDDSLKERLVPSFEVGCRRINPGEAYLRALQESNVTPVFDGIDHITPSGVVAGGMEYKFDAIITATGFNTSFKPRFPIIGRRGVNLQDLWAEEPVSYFGTGVSGFPNYLIFLGPNTPISNGSIMGPLEATGDYFIRIMTRLIRRRIKSFNVRETAQTDFDKHTQEQMRNKVWSGSCRSWFKKGLDGKITALWPGSSLHYMQCLAEDRWEDYEWDYECNRFGYWRDGLSWIEKPSRDPLGIDERDFHQVMTTIPTRTSDLSFYLRDTESLPSNVLEPLKEINGTPVDGIEETVEVCGTETTEHGKEHVVRHQHGSDIIVPV